MTFPHPFVAVAGNIGVGKSTLTKMLAERFGWQPFYEANDDNPYLEDFYDDMERWSFHSQVFFLGKRLEHHRQLLAHSGGVVQDRTIYEDAEIFACNLYQQGHINALDYETYCRLYQAMIAFLPSPDLVIFLEGNVQTLQQHIQKRGRSFEQNIAPDYLQQLNSLYGKWIGSWTLSPVMRLSMNTLDFEHNPADFEQIVHRVSHSLSHA